MNLSRWGRLVAWPHHCSSGFLSAERPCAVFHRRTYASSQRCLRRCFHAFVRTHIVRESKMSAMLTIIGLAIYQKKVSLCSLTTGMGSKFMPAIVSAIKLIASSLKTVTVTVLLTEVSSQECKREEEA